MSKLDFPDSKFSLYFLGFHEAGDIPSDKAERVCQILVSSSGGYAIPVVLWVAFQLRGSTPSPVYIPLLKYRSISVCFASRLSGCSSSLPP